MNNGSCFRRIAIGLFPKCYSRNYIGCCNQRRSISYSYDIPASGTRKLNHSTQSLVSQDSNDIPSKLLKQQRRLKRKKKMKSNLRFPSSRVFVSCLPGLENILSSELTALNIDHQSQIGGATLSSKNKPVVSIIDNIYRCHLYLGTATEIRVRCTDKPFRARTFPELRRKVRTFISWKDILDTTNNNEKHSIHILTKVTSNKSKLYHTSAIGERIIEEINNSLKQNNSDIEDNDSNDDNVDFIKCVIDLENHSEEESTLVIKLDVRITRDMFDIGLCTSVTPLHRRGYRFETAKAPLREDIAYAMVWSSGWKPSYFINDGRTKHNKNNQNILLDPFCGSGTIAIEAAAMANGLPPGRFLDPPLQGTKLYDEEKWLRIMQTGNASTTNKRKQIEIPTVYASDRDKGAIKATERNAKRAGVFDFMDIRHCSLASQPLWETFWGSKSSSPSRSSLFVVTNPPFGNRISAKNSNTKGHATSNEMLLPLYQTLANHIQRCKKGCSSFAILTNNPNLVARTGLKDSMKTLTLSHGGRPAYVIQSSDQGYTNS